jgi:hypothetical protein
MLTAFAFWKQRRKAGLLSGSGPPFLTAMAISLPMRVKFLAILSQRANMADLRTSNILPMVETHFGRANLRGFFN